MFALRYVQAGRERNWHALIHVHILVNDLWYEKKDQSFFRINDTTYELVACGIVRLIRAKLLLYLTFIFTCCRSNELLPCKSFKNLVNNLKIKEIFL